MGGALALPTTATTSKTTTETKETSVTAAKATAIATTISASLSPDVLNLEARSDEGYSKLMLAAKEGRVSEIALLLQKGAQIDGSDPVFGTALMVAAMEGQEEAVQALVDHKAALEFSSELHGYTPLLAACQNGHARVVQQLLQLGANPNASTKRGFTGVMMVSMDNPHILSLLLDKGALPDTVNEHGMTALMIAARNSRLGSVEILLAAGANVKTKDSDGVGAIQLASCPNVLTALYVAAHKQKQGRGIHARYECHEVLGEGAFGKVRRAVRLTDRLPVAIKAIRLAKLTSTDLALIDNEVKIMKQVDHDNCVRLIEVSETPTKRYLVMELCRGNLHERLVKEGPLTETGAKHVIRGVASALRHLHALGVAHRDLKLENVMLGQGPGGEPDCPKLADFGISKIHHGQLMRTSCGTSTYAAPEVLGTAGYGPEADLWSLGVILYMLLSGFPPFHHENVPSLFAIIKKGEFSFAASQWAHVSDTSKALIRALLVLDPKQRPSPGQVLNHPWLTCQDAPNQDPGLVIHF